ncbi:unnamed protein product [Paramecium sonneborni]|uniref:Uncharacterized protein n=1 Tax=Paramecium sonneborni TaxID=65129 RepID=A0A8S1JTI7_9CILI|nr:unnamed protein product [Paramecium sonneborni]
MVEKFSNFEKNSNKSSKHFDKIRSYYVFRTIIKWKTQQLSNEFSTCKLENLISLYYNLINHSNLKKLILQNIYQKMNFGQIDDLVLVEDNQSGATNYNQNKDAEFKPRFPSIPSFPRTGFPPAPNQGFLHSPNQGFAPPPNQGFAPPPNQGCPPPPNQGYTPAPNQGYTAAPNQGFPHAPNQSFTPTNQGYTPPPNQGFPPPNQGYTPPPNQGFPPPNQGFPPPNQGFPPPNQSFTPSPNQVFPRAFPNAGPNPNIRPVFPQNPNDVKIQPPLNDDKQQPFTQIPFQPHLVNASVYHDRIINTKQDKIDLVKDFNKYLNEGNLLFAQNCLKQIIDNDIRVRID